MTIASGTIRKRTEHFFPTLLLPDQFRILGRPDNALILDAGLAPGKLALDEIRSKGFIPSS